MTPHGDGRNLQPPVQPRVRIREEAAESGPNDVNKMEDRGRVSGSPDFGTLLRHYRLAAGLSQEALAERARMSTQGISALERGYRRTPQRETLALLVEALALNDEQRVKFEATAARTVLLGRLARVTAGPWADAAIVNLPFALTSFVGRECELDEIAKLMRHHRMVTLTGVGGVGKTQTALHVANAPSDAGDDAVCFIGLAPIGNPSLVTSTIASTLGLQEVPDRPLLETLVAYLKNKVLLLLLDNCEHVIGEVVTVAQALLAGCPRVRILATSREALRAAGEYIYRLPSLPVPSAEAARTLSAAGAVEYGAVVLFTNRAQAAESHFAITDENAPTVADLCRRLDGIPLAIELAAARVNVLPVERIVEHLANRFRILTGGERTALPRQQTMRATIDWSYDLLCAPEQKLFERLSVFAGGCTLAAATDVCAGGDVSEGNVLDLLSSLVDKSLVVSDLRVSESRYYLLESFRQYAQEKLSARGEQEQVAHRHALALLKVAEELDVAWDTAADLAWADVTRLELDNLRVAVSWALAGRGDILAGQRLAALAPMWEPFAPLERRRWIALARAAIDESTPSSVLAELSFADCLISHHLNEHAFELAHGRDALDRYTALGDELGMVRSEIHVGRALVALRRISEAKPVLRDALDHARRLGLVRWTAFAVTTTATACYFTGDFATARRYIDEERAIYESIGDVKLGQLALRQLAACEFYAGNVSAAVRYGSEAVSTLRGFRDMRVLADTLDLTALFLASAGDYDRAQAHAREALVIQSEQHLGRDLLVSVQRFLTIAVARPPRELEDPQRHGPAARLLGFVDARLLAHGARRTPIEEEEYERAIGGLRDAMGTDTVANLMSEGATMTEEQAVALALAL
jgi:predicted ATPase/transcriptional regulator with XRE-family HTH domain